MLNERRPPVGAHRVPIFDLSVSSDAPGERIGAKWVKATGRCSERVLWCES
jgi:hypothetical protein